MTFEEEEAYIRRIEELKDQVTNLEAKNEELRNQIAKLKNECRVAHIVWDA